jgi:hypothetical protein
VIDVIPLQRISGIKFKRRGGKGTPDREEYDARCLPTAVAGTAATLRRRRRASSQEN